MSVRAVIATARIQPSMRVQNVDMTGTGDNALTWLMPVPSRYIIRRCLVRLVSGAFGVACLGGLYTAAAKGGSAIVAATQTYAALSGAGLVTDATLAAVAGTTVVTAPQLFFALSTGNTGALVADVYVYIDVLDT